MPTVTVPTPPVLATVPGVELMHTGQWNAMTGTHTFTAEDLAAAIAALDCPAVRRPVLKFGHDSYHGQGLPALGSVGNMRLKNDGRTLAGDYVGVPGWLATVDDNGLSVLSSAYPDRSIEGEWNYRCQIGHLHPFVVHAVALLGVERPGIGTLPSLQDLAATFGVALSNPAPTGTPVTLTIRDGHVAVSADAVKTKAMVALLPSAADAERLVVDGGLPVDELHLTLLFLGDAADWDIDQRQAVIAGVESLRGSGAVDGDGFALSVFNAGSDDKDTCIVLGVGGQPVEDIHAAVTSAVPGDNLPGQHHPWAAHLSLIYTDDLTQIADLIDRTGPVAFDRIRVAFAGDNTDIPLTDMTQASTGPGGRSTMPNSSPLQVSAAVTSDDVRREYYDTASWEYWIAEFQLDPALQLIVTSDKDGSYSRVPVTVDGDQITFAEPIPVNVVYVDKSTGDTAQAAAMTVMASTAAAGRRIAWASRVESRPGDKPAATEPADEPTPEVPDEAPEDVPAAEPDATTNQEDDMSLSAIRARLGLGDDADEAAVLAALNAALPTDPGDNASSEPEVPAVQPTPAPAAASTKARLPDGVVAIDETTLAELKRNAALGAQAAERQRISDRDKVIEAAVTDGKISPARKPHWVKAWEADPDGTSADLASLEAGLHVPTVMAGTTGTGEETVDLDGFSDDATSAWAQQLGIDVKELSRG